MSYKIAVFGSEGMLGRYVTAKLCENNLVWPHSRKELDLAYVTGWELAGLLLQEKFDFVVNCAGIIKQRKDTFLLETVKVNSVFPLLLADECQQRSIPLIHISTDCVFSGKKTKPYNEDDLHDALDTYGKSKSLGEPENACVIRTSIIGEKQNDDRSLLEWAKSKKGQKIKGYTNHYWNGVTCWQLSKVIEEIIEKRKFWKGVRHIHSPAFVSKYTLLNFINEAYDLDLEIEKEKSEYCNRRLSSKYDIEYDIPKIRDQIFEQRDFI